MKLKRIFSDTRKNLIERIRVKDENNKIMLIFDSFVEAVSLVEVAENCLKKYNLYMFCDNTWDIYKIEYE